MLNHQANLAAQHVALELAHARQVEFVDELAVDASLEVFKFDAFRVFGGSQGGGLHDRSWQDFFRW